jgi:hypothetical protein
MNTIHFNTGRNYTIHGQRISATLHDDSKITFYDHDRMIDGECECVGEFGQNAVMAGYDHAYKSTKRSWENSMMVGGCNSIYQES